MSCATMGKKSNNALRITPYINWLTDVIGFNNGHASVNARNSRKTMIVIRKFLPQKYLPFEATFSIEIV